MVARIKGAIGYVEYAYAKQNKLTYAKLMNKNGKAVAPTIESFSAAAANANWEATPGFGVILTNEPGAATWPIAGATFILIHKQPSDAAAAGAALKFFNWAYAKGGKMAEELDYVPMPGNVVTAVRGFGPPRSRMQAASHSSFFPSNRCAPASLAARRRLRRHCADEDHDILIAARPSLANSIRVAKSAFIHNGLGCHPTVMEWS
jgi:hypothetical protein